MAGRSLNVCGITLILSKKVRSASFYEGCTKKATAKFRINVEQNVDSFNLLQSYEQLKNLKKNYFADFYKRTN